MPAPARPSDRSPRLFNTLLVSAGRAALRYLGTHPAVAALAGALAISWSAILFRLAAVSPATGAFYRCLWAVPVLLVLARLEDRRLGPRPAVARRLAWAAVVFLAVDLITWHHAIEAVGAGLATVLGNAQVVMVGLAAWLLLGERLQARYLLAIPPVAIGMVLISGVVGSGAYGSHPALGVLFGLLTSVAYTGFILTLRRGNADLRRPAGPLCDATLAAALVAGIGGAVLRDLDPLPTAASQGWLVVLALETQVVGWLLISVSLPRLPAALTSIILTVQPVGSMILAGLVCAESPSPAQLGGVALIVCGLLIAAARRQARRPVAAEPTPALAGGVPG